MAAVTNSSREVFLQKRNSQVPTAALRRTVASMGERDWASLDQGLLHDIFTRVPGDADAASFRHACRGWRAVAGPGALIPSPWFVLRSATDRRCAFVRPAGRRRVRHVRLDATARGDEATPCASRGWLAVNDNERLVLRDPISCAEVPLPAFDDPVYELSEIFLSDDPLDEPGRCTAFAFFNRSDIAYAGRVLAFCRPGDAEWARFDLNGQQVGLYLGLEFFRGRAYVLVGTDCSLAVCDVHTRSLVATSVTLRHLMDWSWDTQLCLVDCGGDLLVVIVKRYEDMRPSCCVVVRRRFAVKVVKFEFAADGIMPVAVSDVKDTGDYALFVSRRGHAFALPASGFPAVRPGCVYHFAANITEKNVSSVVITDLLDLAERRNKPHRKLPLAGKWHPVSWLWPRRRSFDTVAAAGRRRRWRS